MSTQDDSNPNGILTRWHLNPQDDWAGTELVDSRDGLVHATFTAATPEALNLIEAAPELLVALRWCITEGLEVNNRCRQAVAKAEGKEVQA
jgi:hypothetical protein